MGLNISILSGEVITDPQTRSVNGKPVTSLRLDDGKGKHNVSIFEAPTLGKGDQVIVQGRLSNRNIAKGDEPARWITEITCSGSNVTVLSSTAKAEVDDGLSFE